MIGASGYGIMFQLQSFRLVLVPILLVVMLRQESIDLLSLY